MKNFKKYVKVYWKLGILSALCVSLEAVCDLFQPKLMSRLIDDGVMKGDMSFVVSTGLTMIFVVALGAVFALSRNIASSYASQMFGRDLRNDLFVKIQSLSVEDIDRFEGGSLITRMTNDVGHIQNFVNMMIRIFLKAPIMCVGAVIMVSTLNLHALFIIFPIIFCVFSVIFTSMKLSYPRFYRAQEALDKFNTSMREYLTGIRLVKAFRRFDAESARFGEANGTLSRRSVEAGRVMAVFSPFLQFFSNMGIIAMIFFGARWVDKGLMAVGGVMAFFVYMQQIAQSFNMISNILNQVVRVKASAERVNEVFNAVPPNVGKEGGARAEKGAAAVEFRNVGFSYRGSTGQSALSDISFSVGRGETLGVIGSTGSGKTSLAALLLRFYEPTAGEIIIGGEKLSDVPETELRDRVTIVPQTAALFTGTIRDNILWGKTEASDEEIISAAETACALDFINEQSDGFDTIMGQGGVNLSGGQKQRVSIARAVIRRPDILVLDDCTSALDVITEAKVKKNLGNFAADMTVVLITQRIGTVMSCDKILVLENGRAAGFGKHSELMGNCALYNDIYLSQIGRDEDGGK